MEKRIYQTKSEIIYQEIKEDIINGKYKPNERIVISDVAREFGASDIPVREAMRHLESDGLIQSKPYVGAIVTNFDLADIRKIYQIRAVLEGLATRQAVDRINKNGLKKLETILSKMVKAVGSGNYVLLSNLNREFHHVIYAASDNEYLIKVIFDLWDMSLRARAIFSFMPERAEAAVDEHANIVAALKKKDKSRADKLVIEHMNSHLKALQLFYERGKIAD
jgi:DNA-binding GntR family transcriptional regulator